eukprot:m.123806 g.123806  ORF g.123806 m.123806 type:complete len:300 (+) comp14457_c0_seq1:226-1125(+)
MSLSILLGLFLLSPSVSNRSSGCVLTPDGDGYTTDNALFGYCLELLGVTLNVTYDDTGVRALAESLNLGVLRYPGGTNSNVWTSKRGGFLPLPTSVSGYNKYIPYAPIINAFPNGTYSARSFVNGLGPYTKRVMWNLNVYTMSPEETCSEIAFIKNATNGKVTHLEMGNELYIPNQGMPRFPNSSAYMEHIIPIIECARQMLPDVKIAVVGEEGEWNQGLRPYSSLFDAVTLHEYAPSLNEVQDLASQERHTYVMGYGFASLARMDSSVNADVGNDANKSTSIWVTEFNYGLQLFFFQS